MLVLWLIIFRAIGLELRSQFNFQMWKDIWDKSFGVASLLLSLFFGIALGNVIRGVNLGGVENGISAYEGHYFFLPLWNSSFSPEGIHPGVIDWFTIVIGVIAVVTLTIHGANWVILKTNSSINEKLKSVIIKLNIALVVLTIFSISIWHIIKPEPFSNFTENPLLFIFPLIYLSGLVGIFFIKKYQKNIYAFVCSSLLILGGISSSLASMFPVIITFYQRCKRIINHLQYCNYSLRIIGCYGMGHYRFYSSVCLYDYSETIDGREKLIRWITDIKNT